MKIKKHIAIVLLTVVAVTAGAPRSYADGPSAQELKRAFSKKPVAAGYIVGGCGWDACSRSGSILGTVKGRFSD
jgi:hypothetical protein